jgi:hypothetical protein
VVLFRVNPVARSLAFHGWLKLEAVAPLADQELLHLLVNAVREALGMVPKLRLWPDPIPDTAVIQRSAEYRRPTWLIPNGKNTAGDVAMRKFCAGVLSLVGLGAKGR